MNQESSESVARAEAARAFERHQAPLRRLLWGILRNQAQVDDMLQTVFLKLVQWQSRWAAESGAAESGAAESGAAAGLSADGLRAWLFRVAANEALLVKRKRRTELRHQEAVAWWLDQQGVSERDGQTQASEAPLAAALRAELRDQVKQMLQRLPREQQQVIQLRIFEDLKFVEISEQLEVPLGTVLARMRAALGKLKSEWEQRE